MGTAFLLKPGGSAILNYTVKSYDSREHFPLYPRDNDIAVITSVEMSKYVIGFNQPIGEPNGTVWISMETSGIFTFSVVKKNAINITVGQCRQLVNGKWVNLEAYYGVASNWNKFSESIRPWLYKSGETYYDNVDLTGGWITSEKVGTSGRLTVTKEFMKIQQGINGGFVSTIKRRFDGRNVKRIIVNIRDISKFGSATLVAAVHKYDRDGNKYINNLATTNPFQTSGRYILDISNAEYAPGDTITFVLRVSVDNIDGNRLSAVIDSITFE